MYKMQNKNAKIDVSIKTTIENRQCIDVNENPERVINYCWLCIICKNIFTFNFVLYSCGLLSWFHIYTNSVDHNINNSANIT